MQLMKVFAKIKSLKLPIVETRDIVALLDTDTTMVSKALARLAIFGHIMQIKRGLWAIPEKVEPMMLPEYLTAPFPSYISLQSALYYHGMIEQIPDIVYAVSITRTKRYKTPIATIFIHHLPPSLFFGFTSVGENHIKIATPEKALFDFLYLIPAKSHLFSSLPELELPKKFSVKQCREWINKIHSKQRKSMMLTNLKNL